MNLPIRFSLRNFLIAFTLICVLIPAVQQVVVAYQAFKLRVIVRAFIDEELARTRMMQDAWKRKAHLELLYDTVARFDDNELDSSERGRWLTEINTCREQTYRECEQLDQERIYACRLEQ